MFATHDQEKWFYCTTSNGCLPIFIVRARSDLDARLVAWQARRLADDATRLPKTRELLRPGRAVAAASDGGRAVRVAAGVARAGD